MYEYQFIEGSDYPLFYFKTCHEYKYHVSFSKMPNDLLKEITIYSICVDCLNSRSPEIDSKVGRTICNILYDFITQNNKSLIAYVCEFGDSRQHARQRKFESWYKRYNSGDCILRRFDVHVEEYDITYYSSVIFDSRIYSSQYIDAIYGEAIKEISCKS